MILSHGGVVALFSNPQVDLDNITSEIHVPIILEALRRSPLSLRSRLVLYVVTDTQHCSNNLKLFT
ncbi:RING/U-box superfamily protein [Prunus dulcis]|uniref:RING/U-box superfamily protein n=1 Tax=Prunus dulcis TaxID=3755 RepID=A0A4Y1QUY8_PRUDU|nr:RING/U-box superfamily protein [Prunus dulcis]